jgi:D-aminopeptidase
MKSCVSTWGLFVLLLGASGYEVAVAASRADTSAATATKVRARALGIPFIGTPGQLNAITDVAGVTVGQVTLISGSGALHIGRGPIRTGVTAILPRGRDGVDVPVYGAWYSLNGSGEMTGTTWVEESGHLEGPIMLTNTHSVGTVRDAVIGWRVRRLPTGVLEKWWALPVVAETYDGWLNDINGFHVTPEDVWQALDSARGGPVVEGNVGGGTGMICNGFKGGIGTASRVLSKSDGAYTVGVLVQCNYGARQNLVIAGVPVGRELGLPPRALANTVGSEDVGSIIVVIATDAPLLAGQLKRIARRVPLALGRLGSTSGNASGDIFLAFSTANAQALSADSNPTGVSPGSNETEDRSVRLDTLPNGVLNPLFDAAVEATEEAIVNAMIAAVSMTGRDDHHVDALPHDQLRQILARYNRLESVPSDAPGKQPE